MIDKIRERLQDVIDGIEVYTVGRLNTEKANISILQLQRFANELKKINEVETKHNNGWISVDDRLPDMDECRKNDNRFIVTDGNRIYQSTFDYIEQRFCEPMYRGTFNTFYDDSVTYWQPLPQLPKGE